MSTSLICLAFCVQTASAWGQQGSVNYVLGIDAQEDGSATEITIHGSASPTFSVYRLEDPPRVFVDFSNCELMGDVTNWSVANGLVDEVLVLQYRDEVSLVTRVVVTLEMDNADYDIQTDGNDVVMTIQADGWDPQSAVADAGSAARSPQSAEQAQHAAELDQRNQQLAQLEGEVDRVAQREQQERQRADQLATTLDRVSTDLDSARDNEREARHAAEGMERRAAQLERELRELAETVGERDLVSEELQAVRERRESVRAELDAVEDERVQLDRAVAHATQQRQEIESQVRQAEADRETAMLALAAVRQEREEAELEAARAREALAELESALATGRDEQEALDRALTERRAERERLERDVAAAIEERQRLDEEVAEAGAERARLETELAEAERERDQLDVEVAQAAAQRDALRSELDEAALRRDSIDDAIADAESELTEAESRRQAIRDEIDEAAAELEAALAERQRLDAELATAQAERSERNADLDAVERERQRIEAQLDAANAERARIDVELEAAAQQRQRLEDELLTRSDERERIEADLADVARQRESLYTELDEATRARESLYDELETAAAERERIRVELDELATVQREESHALSETRERRQQLESEIQELQTQRRSAAASLDGVDSERRQAQAILDDLETERRTLVAGIRQVEAQQDDERAELARLEAERSSAESALSATSEERERLAVEVLDMEQRLADMRAEYESQTALASRQAEADAEADREAEQTPNQNEAPRAVEEPVPAAVERAIVDVRFEQVGGVDRITVEFDGPAPAVDSLPWTEGRAALVIDAAELPAPLRRTFDTRAFGGPVQFISSFTDDTGRVNVVAQLSEAASEILTDDGRSVTWEFSSIGAMAQAEPAEDSGSQFDGYNAQEEGSSAPPIPRPRGVTYTIGQRESGLRTPRLSRRFRVTIDVVNADIQNVLRLFSDQGDVNIIASAGVQGTITLRLRDVPLDLAFALILQSQGMGFSQQGNIIRVAPMAEFEEERQRELARVAEAFDVEPLQVRLRPISYASGSDMIRLLGDILSARGSATFDDRTHTLIMTDVAENLDAAEQLIDALDTQTPQVLIESRIVQTTETFSQGFGIQWGGDTLFSAANGNATGLLFPSTIGIAGGAGQTPNDGTSATPNYAVNLPGPSNGAIGFQFGSLGQAVNLNLRLSAAETSGEAKVVSAPRILTLDGQAASISTGVSIPVQTVGAAGTNVTFIQANLSLSVTPTVTPDGFVHLDLNVSKDEPDFARTGANGDPSIQTRTATTNLLVRDGETSVIGGIFEHIQGSDQNAVPFFSDIPILGALFHDYSFQDERTETLIFITPRIVNRDVSLTNYAPGGVLMTPPD